jgi:hypothetical protein
MMEYFTKSGFGIGKEPSSGGSITARLMGLRQGSGAAPIGMQSMITLVDNAYKRLGHGMNAKFLLADRICLLAAIIYVDDRDLLHWAKFYGVSDDAFMDEIQKGVHCMTGGCWCRPQEAVSNNLRVSGTCSHGNLFVGSLPSSPSRNYLHGR